MATHVLVEASHGVTAHGRRKVAGREGEDKVRTSLSGVLGELDRFPSRLSTDSPSNDSTVVADLEERSLTKTNKLFISPCADCKRLTVFFSSRVRRGASPVDPWIVRPCRPASAIRV